jgi:hypothetical protein
MLKRAVSKIVLTRSREGLDGFPAGYDVIARDGLGDVLALGSEGKVWSFHHGEGSWRPSLAFASRTQLEAYLAFQVRFEWPCDADLATLLTRKAELAAFAKTMRGAPYARAALESVKADLAEDLADRRHATSKRGQSLAARQAFGQECEQALRAAGVNRRILVRAHANDPRAVVVLGDFTSPWTEARLRELVEPRATEAGYTLHFYASP